MLGVLALVNHRADDRPDGQIAPPLSDNQSRQQVLDPARQFVRAGNMRGLNAGYLLASCTSEEQPPYRGVVYLNFEIPRIAETRAYFIEIARTMIARGWREGVPPGRHPGGHALAKDSLYAVYYRDPDLAGRGVLKVYGECRNLTGHRLDDIGFVDVTGLLQG